MSFWLWIALRNLKKGGRLLGTTSAFAFFGLVFGVASLVVAMAVMSGFESTLRKAIVDMSGDLMIVKRSRNIEPPQEFLSRVQEVDPTVVEGTPFAIVEAMAAHGGHVSGVVLQGVDLQTYAKVLNYQSRLLSGSVNFVEDEDGLPGVLIGKGLADMFGLKSGDYFNVVLPIANEFNPSEFRRKLQKLVVRGVVELGKYSYDQRYIIIDLSALQAFANLEDRYHGLFLRLEDYAKARQVSVKLSREMEGPYWTRDWSEDALFEAVRLEKIAIFFVLLIIVIVSAFNISSSLFISVVQRYADISILKALGASPQKIIHVFLYQGLSIGGAGLLLGYGLGLLFCFAFLWLNNSYHLMEASTYKLSHIDIQLQWTDFIWVAIATLVICLFATLAPAQKGAKLNAVEGLRYE